MAPDGNGIENRGQLRVNASMMAAQAAMMQALETGSQTIQ